MGTFHDTRDPLHGITVVATAGDSVYVGRCHARENDQIVLHDVDVHTEGEDGKTNREYLDRAARFGVWQKHQQLVLAAAEVSGLAPLSEYFRRPGEAAAVSAPPPAPVAAAEPVAAPVSTPVQLTEAAVAEVRRLLADEDQTDKGLRLAVSGGGCSGLVYKVEFDNRQEGDTVVSCEGFDVLLDRKSLIYLRGITLDHQAGLSGRGFQFHNPNASNTCGCGESFSV